MTTITPLPYPMILRDVPKKPLVLCSVLAALLPCASRLTAQETEPDWQLVWWDEFDQPGAPDANRWTPEVGYIRNNEAQYYTANRSENARVEDGHLVLEARRDQWDGHEYTSASLHTAQTASWTYGRIEVRAKIPTGRGMWPAIWMLGTNIGQVGWPDCGEIDIMENVGYDPRIIHANVHTGAFNHADGTANGGTLEADDPWNDFHTYAIEWYPDRIDFFFDDHRYHRFEKEGTTNDVWPFDAPQYLILNVAVGGGWGGTQGIDDSIFPQQMRVDYVRVYQQKQAGPYQVDLTAVGPGRVRLEPAQDSYADGSEVRLVADPDVGMRFGGWSGALLPPRWSLPLTIDRDLALVARFETPGELLQNGHFTTDRQGWQGPWPANGAETTVHADAAELVIETTQAGPNPWDIQILQGGLRLVQGNRYRLSFEASSTVSGTVPVSAELNGAPYTAFGRIQAELTAEPQTFSHEFTMEAPSNDNVRVAFNLGQIPGTIRLDNVSLIGLDERDLSPYEIWKAERGIRPVQNDRDADQDGIPTILEYAFGTEDDQPTPSPIEVREQDGTWQVALSPRAPGRDDVTVLLEHSDDLAEWISIESPPPVLSSGSPDFFRLIGEMATQ